MAEFEEKITKLQQMIDDSQSICFFTGAGISVPSGIPDFRSASGIYNQTDGYTYSPEEMVSHTFLYSHTKDFYEFYRSKMLWPDAQPNDAHKYIAALQERKDVSVVTQNIDGLHQKAGSRRVYELHGSVERNYCTRCGKRFPASFIAGSTGVPKCDVCGALVRPDVVLYEEGLDGDVIEGAVNAIASADMLVVIGTSLVVYPAASFVRYYRGDKFMVVNLSQTPYDRYTNLAVYEDCARVARALT